MPKSTELVGQRGWKYASMGKGQGKPHGPVSSQEMVELIKNKTVIEETRVCHSVYTEGSWKKAIEIDRLEGHFGEGGHWGTGKNKAVNDGYCPHCDHIFDRRMLAERTGMKTFDDHQKKKKGNRVCCEGCQKWIKYNWKKKALGITEAPQLPSTGSLVSIAAVTLNTVRESLYFIFMDS